MTLARVPSSVRARLQTVVGRLPRQDTDPDVWDDLAIENASLAAARGRANQDLLGGDR